MIRRTFLAALGAVLAGPKMLMAGKPKPGITQADIDGVVASYRASIQTCPCCGKVISPPHGAHYCDGEILEPFTATKGSGSSDIEIEWFDLSKPMDAQ
jgi:hypothetical protein